jgi:hypothetical protein
MKKIFTMIAAFALNQAVAQVITNANFPITGEVWIEFEDANGSMVNIGPGGAGQTWNYSSSFNIVDTVGVLFRPVSSAPAYMNALANFPGASLVVVNDLIDSSATFIKTNTTGLYFDGIYEQGTINDTALNINISALDYNPDKLIIPAPFALNDTRDNNAKWHVEFSYSIPPFVVQVSLDNYTIQNFVADGSGTLTTPLGTFNNVLRIKEYSYQLDSTSYDLPFIPDTARAHDTIINYSFVHANSHCLLMTAEVDPITNLTTKASYYDPIVLVGGSENENIPVTLYPNPANESFYFNHIRKNSSIQIFDVTGNLIRDEYLGSFESSIKVNTENMPAGIYFFKISNANNAVYHNGKFEVVK